MKTIVMIIAMAAFSYNVMADDEPKKIGDKYCAKMKDGKLTIMHEGTALNSDVTLDNGTQIKMDGTIIKKDGTRTTLKEGQCINEEGKIKGKEKDKDDRDDKKMDKKSDKPDDKKY